MTDESKDIRASEEILVRCITAYEVQDAGELSLSIGDVVRVTEQTDTGWWKGVNEVTKQEGGFPANVVERVSESGAEVLDRHENEAEEAREPEAPRLAMIEYDYEARDSDELSLRKGSVITVLEQNDGWWKGDLNGQIGVFPANHVKLIEVSAGSGDTREQGEHNDNKDKIIHRIAAYGVKTGGIGGLFSGGIPSLKKTKRGVEDSKDTHKAEERSVPTVEFKLRRAGSRSADSTEFDQSKKEKLASPPVVPTQHNRPDDIEKGSIKAPKGRPPKIVRKARVLHDYEAEAEDEISLQEGTLVVILEKLDEEGWWKGRNEQDSVGIFPSTYVQELKSGDEHSHQEMAIDSQVTDSISKYASEDERNVDDIQHEPELAPVPAGTITPSQTIMEDVAVIAVSHSAIPKDIASKSFSEDTQPSPTDTPKRPPSLYERSSHDSHNYHHESIPQRRSTYDLPSPITQKRASQDLSRVRPSSLVSADLPPIMPVRSGSKSPPPPPIRQLPHPTSILMENTDEINDSKLTAESYPMPPPKPSSQPQSSVDTKTESSRSPPTLAKPPPVPRMTMAKSSLARKPSLHEDGRETTIAAPTPAVPPRPKQQKDLPEVQLVKPLKPSSPNADRQDTEGDTGAYSSKSAQKSNVHEQVTEETEETVNENGELESKAQTKTIVDISTEPKSTVTTVTEQKIIDMDEEDSDKQTNEKKESSLKKLDSPLSPVVPHPMGLEQDQPAMTTKVPGTRNVKESAGLSQTNVLEDATMDQAKEAKIDAEPSFHPTDSALTMPPKPSKPPKPNFVKLPLTAGGTSAVQLRSITKKPIEIPLTTETESVTKPTTTEPSIDTKPISSGGVKSLSNRFNQFGGIPNQSADVELRVKKFVNEELSKMKADFSSKLAQEKQAREALEKEVEVLKTKLEEMGV